MTAGSIAVPMVIPLRAPVMGQTKSDIDSNTKIELRTETPDVGIYYTINGTKPTPFTPVGAEQCTLKYRGPFTLPAGKRSVKVLALSRDGMRESNVVTKTFDVTYAAIVTNGAGDDGLSFQDQLNKERRVYEMKTAAKNFLLSSKSAWGQTTNSKLRETEQMMNDMLLADVDNRRQSSGARFLSSRFDKSPDRSASRIDTTRSNMLFSARSEKALPENATQMLRLQRETDFMKCVYCFSDRPSDPFAKFCTKCGNVVPPLPKGGLSPPEPGQMGPCMFCKAIVPLNTVSCLVCEAPLSQQNVPKASIKLAERKVCTVCGTANPADLSSCVTCDSRLPTVARNVGQVVATTPATPKNTSNLQRCTQCGRFNNPDARFCDWCGAKPGQQMNVTLNCSTCGASNHQQTNYCFRCGVKIEPPLRNGMLTSSVDLAGRVQAEWTPVTVPPGGSMVPKAMTSVSTQTVGLFYPSQCKISKQEEDNKKRHSLAGAMSDRRPPLTAVSPGRGYWRQQIDHICGHLKAYAANNAEFRALVAEPKMGNLISGSIHEDGYELSLTVNFALRGKHDSLTGKSFGLSLGNYLSNHTMNDSDDLESRSDLMSEPLTPTSTRPSSSRLGSVKRRSAKKVYKPRKKDVEKLSAEDRKLLKELSAGGEGRAAEVQQLIDEGADPSCVNKDDLPLLHIAVKNKHEDCIPVLIQAGALVNRKGPPSIKGNSALHEAISLGNSALPVIDALIGCGVNIQQKNDRGESAYDLAAKSGYEAIVKRLASSIGQSQLEKMIKPRV